MSNTSDTFHTSLSRSHVKILKTLRRKKGRQQQNCILVEGVRLCEEALNAGVTVKEAIVLESVRENERVKPLLQRCQTAGIPIYIVGPKSFQVISEEPSPQGVALVIRKRSEASREKEQAPFILACEDIRDPGNLGTLLRSADWFGVKHCLLSAGCVDMYNSKVIRASMGSVFRVGIEYEKDFVRALEKLQSKGYRLIATVSREKQNLELNRLGKSDRDILIIGNEATGLSAEVRRLADVRVSISGQEHVESLNAAIAGSICLYQLLHSGENP